jgi:predicted enzyme related to lactoylglutathione lyase
MPGKYGHFCWYELMTSDAPAAERFYRAVVGWGAQAQDEGYTLLTAGEQPVAGLMPWAEGAPAWIGYISVEDVETAVVDIKTNGGQLHRPPADIPGVGRFAVVADPQGAVFVVMQPDPYLPPPEVPLGTPGHIGWAELNAADGPTAFPFYATQFGWTQAEFPSIDGPLGGEQPPPMFYQLFSTVGEGGMSGGIGTMPPEAPRPHWVFYFNVDDIDSATARVRAAGGQVLMEPMEVPGGGWIINAIDPQGAVFALTGPRA